MLRSLTTSNPLSLLQIPKSKTSKQSSLELKLERRERKVTLCAKKRNFNVEVVVGEDDDMEVRLDLFNRQIVRTGLFREWRRRRFYENAREKLKRKRREAALLRRRRRLHRQKASLEQNEESQIENDSMEDEFWAFSDEEFDELIDDEEDSNEELELYFQDGDGEGTWHVL
ncbi:uncharacterized protein LOC144551508 [Carex rostrata]